MEYQSSGHTLENILAEHPFLKEMKKQHLQLIAGCASNVRFKAKEFLFRQGEAANQFFLIRHGEVSLEFYVRHRGVVKIQTIGENDILGWSWLFPPFLWEFDARAMEPIRAIALDGSCLRDKCEVDHEFGYYVLKWLAHIMAQRLQKTRFQLLDIYASAKK
ncbi:MAG: cyclic nucleotide-binding domain-containing protein [SAR324 cluster bacterium]|nr:cyclic nucleotide-binding domain-containing protein [SAR324 cluster bacterium]